MLAVKTGEPADSLLAYFQNISFDELTAALNTDAKAKAFWLNIYNAYTQVLLQKNPGAYKHRNRFFKSRSIGIAGMKLSLDFIEHHIIRRSEWKPGLGYIKLLFPSSLEKQLRLSKKDYRIHFALNCGAKSCPPIAFYDDEKLEEQLNLAEKSFIKNDAGFDEAANQVSVSKIFSWFRGDFGGKKGLKKLLLKHSMVPAGKKVKLKFRPYDWRLLLKKF
ncbi:MAG: DUF547 domain-containing protein [Chitinophagaceae bacterium]|nr:DUF547 domain-containing protein [Chitinophagaceae bacterium]